MRQIYDTTSLTFIINRYQWLLDKLAEMQVAKPYCKNAIVSIVVNINELNPGIPFKVIQVSDHKTKISISIDNLAKYLNGELSQRLILLEEEKILQARPAFNKKAVS